MATAAHLKGILTFTGDVFGVGPRTVDDAKIARIKSWFENEYSDELDGNAATANDFGAWLYRQIAPKVKNYETGLRDAANSEPAVEDLG